MSTTTTATNQTILRPSVPYKAEVDISAAGADVGIAGDGFVLRLLASQFGYGGEAPDMIHDKAGYYLLSRKGLKPILMINISERDPEDSIRKNLLNALKTYSKYLAGKTVWLPTLATADAWLDPIESHNITTQVLNQVAGQFAQTVFLLAIPKRAKEIADVIGNFPLFLEEFRKLDQCQFWYVQNNDAHIGNTSPGLVEIIQQVKDHPETQQWKPGDWIIGLGVESGETLLTIGRVLQFQSTEGISVQTAYVKQNQISWQQSQEIAAMSGLKIAKVKATRVWKVNQQFFVNIVRLTELVKYLPPSPPVRDRIPFHLDQVVTDDLLTREPIAISLANLLNDEIFKRIENTEAPASSETLPKKTKVKKDFSNAFMIHLQGAWGDGKSTFLKLLEKNLSTPEKKWVVVNFNAWEHQHIQPPWWTFLAEIYRQASPKLHWWRQFKLWIFEYYRRFMPSKGLSLCLMVVFATLLYMLRSPLYNFSESFFDDLPQAEASNAAKPAHAVVGDTSIVVDSVKSAADKAVVDPDAAKQAATAKKDENPLDTYLGLIAAVATAIGLLYSLAKSLITPFFLTSPDDAISFMKRSVDPMAKIKKHFSKLVSNLNNFNYEVAIFIDDLDRCNDKFTIDLLEGIQTLFRHKRVLYVVAGDRHWISNCFENHYEKYRDVAREPGQKLGYLFLEKAFQLSIRLPNVSSEDKQKYWEFILDPASNQRSSESDALGNNAKPSARAKMDNVSPEAKAKAEEIVSNTFSKETMAGADTIDKLVAEHNLDRNVAKNILLSAMDKSHEDVKHLLINHSQIIDANPRGIIRLANQYTIYRNILTIEEKKFHRDKLFRWLVLQNKYPVFTDWLELNAASFEDDGQLPKKLQPLITDPMWARLMMDKDKQRGGPILASDIFTFIGGDPREMKAPSRKRPATPMAKQMGK